MKMGLLNWALISVLAGIAPLAAAQRIEGARQKPNQDKAEDSANAPDCAEEAGVIGATEGSNLGQPELSVRRPPWVFENRTGQALESKAPGQGARGSRGRSDRLGGHRAQAGIGSAT